MIGQLAEVFGLADESTVPLNGKVGKVVQVSEDPHQVILETFDGLRIDVPEANLKEFTPAKPDAGGFNVVWPRGSEGAADAEGAAEFAADVAHTLKNQDYCVIQMFMSDENSAAAVSEASRGKIKLKRMKREFEVAYLGREHSCKTGWLEGIADTSQELETALDLCDGYLSNFTELMAPLAPFALDFTPYSRTSGMVRVPLTGAKEEKGLQGDDINDEDIDEGLVDSHIQYLKRRQICLLFVVATQGGTVTLIPKEEERQEVKLPLVKGRLIAFRTSSLTYMYKPAGTSDLVLQAWVLSTPDQLEFKAIQGDQISKDEAMGMERGPNTPEGRRTHVIGMSCGFNGGAQNGPDSWWATVCGGTDGVCKVPFARWDMDVYSKPEAEWQPGFTYTVHGGFVVEDIFSLDNKFFGISEGEAWIMGPGQKHFLEKGYEALYRGGFTRAALDGRKIGIFVGHSGDDWTCSSTYTCGSHDAFEHGHQARHWSVLTTRLAFIFGLKGPQALVDTACSSSLCAYGIGHAMMRHKEGDQADYSISNRLEEGLMGGVNMVPGPGGHIGCCGPHMLSVMGRCFTFDQSADGYCRGEGTGALYARNQEKDTEASWATVIGTCLNQDGRSASMTAPNGPSQQDCIRGSMREAGLSANQVTQAELHGTGTALGDPIEVGALRGVMQDRESPLMQASAKSHIAHLEASAGQAGIQKCILMCCACTGTPNCHLITLNPHLDVNGYPTIFNTEITDYGANSGLSGVSSFGFGGANSRADVFSAAKRGPRRTGVLNLEQIDYITLTCPIDEGPMHYMDGKSVPLASSVTYKRGRYHADAIRDEFASYDVSSNSYTGQYQLQPKDAGMDEAPADDVYIVGTWDGYRESWPVEKESQDTWTCLVTLGETRWEQFQFRLDKNPSRAIFPVAKKGSMVTRVTGPDFEGDGLYWLIDGRDEEVPAGTEYRITLHWGAVPSVVWKVETSPEKAAEPDKDFMKAWGFGNVKKSRKPTRQSGAACGAHTYSVVGTWTAWKCLDMQDVSKVEDEENVWETSLRIGITAYERFRFVRDNDVNQVIYPAKDEGGEAAPVRGPDDLCNDKAWRITGKSGEMVKLRLQVVDAHVIVTTVSKKTARTISYESIEGPKRHTYSVSGSFNDWGYEEMVADEKRPGVFTFQVTVGANLQEFVKIVVDEDSELALFPEEGYSAPGTSIARGPGRPPKGPDGAYWAVSSLRAGAVFEVIVNRHAVDKRKIVDLRWVSDPVDFESMKAAVYEAIVYQ